MCRVEEGEAGRFEFRTGLLNCLEIGHLELHARLRNGSVRGPIIASKAGLCGLSQWPDAEVFGPVDVFAVQIVVTLGRPKRKAQGRDIQGPTLLGVRRDDGHARDGLDLHGLLLWFARGAPLSDHEEPRATL
jgi:hypothetical protein